MGGFNRGFSKLSIVSLACTRLTLHTGVLLAIIFTSQEKIVHHGTFGLLSPPLQRHQTMDSEQRKPMNQTIIFKKKKKLNLETAILLQTVGINNKVTFT